MAEGEPMDYEYAWNNAAQNIIYTINGFLLRDNISAAEYDSLLFNYKQIPDKIKAFGTSFGKVGEVNTQLRELQRKISTEPMDIDLPAVQLAQPNIQIPITTGNIYNICQALQQQYEIISRIVIRNNTIPEVEQAIQQMTQIIDGINQHQADYIGFTNTLPDGPVKIQSKNYIMARINFIRKKYSYFKALLLRLQGAPEPLVYLRTLIDADIEGVPVQHIRQRRINGINIQPICNGNLWAFVRDIYVRNTISSIPDSATQRNIMMNYFRKSIIQDESIGEIAFDTLNNDHQTSLELNSYGVVINDITFKPGTQIVRRHLNQPIVEPVRLRAQADFQYTTESIVDAPTPQGRMFGNNNQNQQLYNTRGGLYIACKIADIRQRNPNGPNNIQNNLLSYIQPQQPVFNAADAAAATAAVPQLGYIHTRNLPQVSIVHDLHISIHGEDLAGGSQSHINFRILNDNQPYSVEINFILVIDQNGNNKIIICSNLGEGSILQISNRLVQIIFNRYDQIRQNNPQVLPQSDIQILDNLQNKELHKIALRNGFYQFLSGLENYLTDLRTTDPSMIPAGNVDNMRIMSSIKRPFTTYIHYNKYLKYKSKYLKLKEMMNKKKLKI
jgi:hypothetical protein